MDELFVKREGDTAVVYPDILITGYLVGYDPKADAIKSLSYED